MEGDGPRVGHRPWEESQRLPLDGSPGAEAVMASIMPLVRARPVEVTLFRAVGEYEGFDDARA